MPLRRAIAWRKKLSTETPGISSGCWKPRNRPSAARSSVGSVVMSVPRSRIRPAVTRYAGLPSRVLASVDLPEPLGPIRRVELAGRHFQAHAPQDLPVVDGHVEVDDLERGRRRGRFRGRRGGLLGHERTL